MKLNGTFSPPGDKSISHRLALMSLLASGECQAANLAPGADVKSSLEAARVLGAAWQSRDGQVTIKGAAGRLVPKARLDCGNSGTTMRLLMGLLAGRNGQYVLDGDESLRKRPMERIAAPLRLMGADIVCSDGRCPVTIRGGRLHGLDYELPVASAQLKSAVLLAGLQAQGPTVVREKVPSRDHTEKMIALFGGSIEATPLGWLVQPSALRLPPAMYVPGDPSSAAFFLCAAAALPGSLVTAEGLLLNPTRTGFIEVLLRMGARLETQTVSEHPEPWGRVTATYSPDLTGCTVEAAEIPALVDEVPILALIATQARGTTIFKQVGELRVKETDRLTAMADGLTRLGAVAEVRGDDLTVQGPTPLSAPPELDSLGDHRLAMTFRLAGILADAHPHIHREDCLEISYPLFPQDLDRLLK